MEVDTSWAKKAVVHVAPSELQRTSHWETVNTLHPGILGEPLHHSSTKIVGKERAFQTYAMTGAISVKLASPEEIHVSRGHVDLAPFEERKEPIVSIAADTLGDNGRSRPSPSSVISRLSSELVQPVPSRPKTTKEINVNAAS